MQARSTKRNRTFWTGRRSRPALKLSPRHGRIRGWRCFFSSRAGRVTPRAVFSHGDFCDGRFRGSDPGWSMAPAQKCSGGKCDCWGQGDGSVQEKKRALEGGARSADLLDGEFFEAGHELTNGQVAHFWRAQYRGPGVASATDWDDPTRTSTPRFSQHVRVWGFRFSPRLARIAGRGLGLVL